MYGFNPAIKIGMLWHLASRIDICNMHSYRFATFLYHKNELSVLSLFVEPQFRPTNFLPPYWRLRTGNLAARHVRLENPAQPVKYQGVVSTIKDSYGFIERADVVDEIFFHFSEAKNIPGGLKLGDDVEFFIQTRNVS